MLKDLLQVITRHSSAFWELDILGSFVGGNVGSSKSASFTIHDTAYNTVVEFDFMYLTFTFPNVSK